MKSPHRWRCLADAEAVAETAATYLARRIRAHIDHHGICHLALPGGSTPARCLERLASHALPWDRLHCYPGDERCLPPGDPARNDSLLREHFWSRIDIPGANLHPIPAELGATEGARRYCPVIEAAGRIDIALLGMGEDGHTASLFPGNPALALTAPVVPVFDAPKPPPERVSLSIPTLSSARERVVLVTGSGKAAALQRVKAGDPLPINRIGPLLGFADVAADPTKSD